MIGEAKRIHIPAVMTHALVALERYEFGLFRGENARSGRLAPWPGAVEVARGWTTVKGVGCDG